MKETKKQEVVAIKKEDLSQDALAHIKRYNDAVERCDKSHWNLAETVSKTVNHKNFDTMFVDRQTYGFHIGVSKSNISKFDKAVKVSESIKGDTKTGAKELGYSVTQCVEMGRLLDKEKDILSFIENYSITPELTCREIRDFVTQELTGIEDKGEEKTEEKEVVVDSTAEEVEEPVVMTITFNGDIITVVDDDLIEKIMELVKQ